MMKTDTTLMAERDQVIAMLDEAIKAAPQSDEPADAKDGFWMRGPAGYTEPDEHGWFGPDGPDMWLPRALCHWQLMVSYPEPNLIAQSNTPQNSLGRWPEIERTVQTYLAHHAEKYPVVPTG